MPHLLVKVSQYRQTTSFHYLTRPELHFITLNGLNYRFPPRQTVTTHEAILLHVLWFSTGQLLKYGASRELLWVPSKTWSSLCRGVYSGWARCAPCETEHDVTFSGSCIQGKITKTLWRYLCIFQPEGVRHMYVLDCSRIGRDISANCFCSCEQGWSRDEWILLSCCFDLTNQGVRHSRRHACRARKLVMDETFVQNRS